MAKRVQSGGGAEGLAKIFTPPNAYQAAQAAASVAQAGRIQRQNQQGDAVRQGLIEGKPLAELQVMAGDNAELQRALPDMWRARIMNDPRMTPEQKDLAFRGAGGAYGATEGGTHYVQGEETNRSRIAAGPGYAAASAALQGHRWEHEDRGARLAQDYRVIQEKPEAVFNPDDNTTHWVPQGSLATLPPGRSMPYSPEAYTAANKPTPYSTAPGSVPVLGRSGDLSAAFAQPNHPTYYAPTGDTVLTQGNEPVEAVAPGDTTPRWVTKGDLIRNPGTYSPVPKPGEKGPAPPQPANLPANADYLAEQALRGQFNLAAGLTGQGFQKGDLGAAGPSTLPPEIEKRLPEFRTQVQRYAQLNNLNFDDAAWQVMTENYGTPTQGAQGQQGFNIQLPTFRSLWLANPSVTPGRPAPPRPVATTQEGHQQITGQDTRLAPQPAGPPRPPPNSPTAALAPPPPPAPAYQPAGSQPPPAPAPTIRLGGNPAPPPAPVPPPAPAAVQPPPAPPPPAPAGPPRPAGMSNADLLGWGQHAISQGAKPEDVFGRLKAWGIDVPPPAAPGP